MGDASAIAASTNADSHAAPVNFPAVSKFERLVNPVPVVPRIAIHHCEECEAGPDEYEEIPGQEDL